jgi:beta-lactam-binding protein with PASTA domain
MFRVHSWPKKLYHYLQIMFAFITKRSLVANILIGIFIALAAVLIFILSLNLITHHGQANAVPSVTGKSLDEATNILEKKGFDVVIQDSIYIDSVPRLAVIRQVPDADEVVKVNRTVYLTINRAIAPYVSMPNLVGYSFRNAQMVLKNMGLRLGDTTFKPDFAKNSVLEQLKNGEKIAPGTKINQGTFISLVLGNGVGQNQFAVPDLTGLTLLQAKTLLESNGLIVGAVIADPQVRDTMNAFIYKQSPPRYDDEKKLLHIRPGQMMDVWLSLQRPVTDSARIQAPLTQQ